MKLSDLKALQEAFKKAAGNLIRKGEFGILGKSNTPINVIINKSSKYATKEESDFQKFNDDLLITALLCKSKEESVENRIPLLKMYNERLDYYKNRSELAKVFSGMGTNQTGYGEEWIPTGFSARLIEKYQLALKVAALFEEIPMPTDPFKISAKASFSSAKLGSEGNAPTASKVGTRVITLDAKKLIDNVPVSYEMEEDSAVAVLPMIENDIANALARAEDTAIINGDTAANHMDTDITDAEDPRKAWNGLRKLCLGGAKKDVSTFTVENLSTLMGLMGIFGLTPGDLAWITGSVGAGKLRVLKDATGNQAVLTMDKMGPQATILNGQVFSLFNSPVILSEFVREDLDANGIYNVAGTYTELILVNRKGFIKGARRALTVETWQDVKAQTKDLVASTRKAFVDSLDAANNPIVAIGLKIS